MAVTIIRYGIVGLVSLVLATPILAATDTKQQASSATVAAINTISVDSQTAISGDLSTVSNSQQVFDIQISNNDPDSFTITFSSQYGGRLRHQTLYAGLNPATYIDYTISTAFESVLGTIGSTPPTLFNQVSLSTQKVMTFSSATASTRNLRYQISFQNTAKATLIAGTYQDTITVTVANR